MDRRQMLQAGAAAIAASAFAERAFAQAAPAAAKKYPIDIYSRQMQWIRPADELAKAAVGMGYDGVNLTVRTYPGHVDPAKVKTDLAPYVKTLRGAGLNVSIITTNIADADSPYAEAILDAAAQVGIHNYWWGTYRYDLSKPIQEQIDAIKPRVEKLVRLNEKYKAKALYHNYSGPGVIGNMIWDLLQVLKLHDPAYVGFHYDLGHASSAGSNGTWALGMRAAGPYIGALAFKDTYLEHFDPSQARPQGGGGPPPQAAAAGAPRPPGAPAGGPPGGGQPRSNYPWRVKYMPLGQGLVDLPQVAEIMKQINFSGPIEIQAEYDLGGADRGEDKITWPREQVLGALKRDLDALRASFKTAGLA